MTQFHIQKKKKKTIYIKILSEAKRKLSKNVVTLYVALVTILILILGSLHYVKRKKKGFFIIIIAYLFLIKEHC